LLLGAVLALERLQHSLLGERGAKVFVIDLDEAGGKEVISEIEQTGGTGYFCQGDVSGECWMPQKLYAA
jgi:hypothetical protein